MWITNQHPFRYNWRTDSWFFNPTTKLLTFNQVPHDMVWDDYDGTEVIVKWVLQDVHPTVGDNYWAATCDDKVLWRLWGCTPPDGNLLEKVWKLALRQKLGV